MKERNESKKVNLEISKDSDEIDNLLETVENRNTKSSFGIESLSESFLPKEQEIKNKKCNFPFIFYFFILILMISISMIIYYIVFYKENKENFRIVEIPWIPLDLNDRLYQDYIFNNNLEILLICDSGFDMDGGSIVIESGYLDNPLEEGIASFATSLISHISFNDTYNIPYLKDYFGNYRFETKEHFTNFRFDILNSGFKKFLSSFGTILNKDFNNFSYFDTYFDSIVREIDLYYQQGEHYIEIRENHLLEYLVYGFRNETNEEILPEGNKQILSLYNYEDLKEKTLNYIEKIIDPEKIKIVLFSKFKFLISSKYMKCYFKKLIEKEKEKKKNKKDEVEKEKYIIKEFNKSQIIYIKAKKYEQNYIKIIYYIEKVKNESFSELFYKSNYFSYIIDFLDEKKEGSLYSLLANNSTFNIKSIESYYEVILKSKIKLTIKLELNLLEKINDIIFITYQFIYKIVKEAIGNELQLGRYKEVRDICYKTINYQEKSFDTIELAKNNGENIIKTKYEPKFYFYFWCPPWNSNITELKEETNLYFSQLQPNNSVIILALRDKDKDKLTCNENSSFYLNCSYFKHSQNIIHTHYYDTYYINDFFNSSNFEKDLDKNNSANIYFRNNSYISKYNESLKNTKKEKLIDFEKLNNKTNTLNKFYFKRNDNFAVPKVYISLDLFHPYLRPNNSDTKDKQCNYFKVIEIFTAIKRKINERLADAIRGGNEFEFGLNENNFYINIYSYSDIAYKIMQRIRNIIFNTTLESTDFKKNNEIYKNEAFDDFLNFDNTDIQAISRYYLYCELKNNLFNKYEFFPEEFEDDEMGYKDCIQKIDGNEFNDLVSFIINGTIYGFYTKDKAEEIYDLFDINTSTLRFNNILDKVEVNIANPVDYFNWVTTIKKLESKSTEKYINIEIFNKSEYNINLGIRYASFKENLVNVSILQTLLNNSKIDYNSRLIDFEIFIYRDIYFGLMLIGEEDEIIPNNELVDIEWKKLLTSCNAYNEPVDKIGNRYYYVKKNFVLSLVKVQTCLIQRAKDEILNYQNEGIIMDPAKIYNEYIQMFDGKKMDDKELDNLLSIFSNISDKNKLDVYTIGN